MRWLRWILLVAVVGLLATGFVYVNAARQSAAGHADLSSIALPVQEGSVDVPSFTPAVSGPINLMIEFQIPANAPADPLPWACQFGIERNPSACAGFEDRVDVAWTVETGGKSVASGVSQSFPFGKVADTGYQRDIGSFQGEKNVTYVVHLTLQTAFSQLAGTNPRLRVRQLPAN